MDTYCLDVFALDPVTLKWVSVEVTVAMDVADHSRYPRLLTQLVGVRVNATILGCSRTTERLLSPAALLSQCQPTRCAFAQLSIRFCAHASRFWLCAGY
jgi:hypothetical protein